MFFVAKEKIGTTLGGQKEYTACTRRGIGFASETRQDGRTVWHYFWPAEMIEPSVRSRFEQNVHSNEDDGGDESPTHYLWSQEVRQSEVVGEPVIAPYTGEGDWIQEARNNFNARAVASVQ